jgi:hypothetical protein
MAAEVCGLEVLEKVYCENRHSLTGYRSSE